MGHQVGRVLCLHHLSCLTLVIFSPSCVFAASKQQSPLQSPSCHHSEEMGTCHVSLDGSDRTESGGSSSPDEEPAPLLIQPSGDRGRSWGTHGPCVGAPQPVCGCWGRWAHGPFLKTGISKVSEVSLELSCYHHLCPGPVYSAEPLLGLRTHSTKCKVLESSDRSKGCTTELLCRALQT